MPSVISDIVVRVKAANLPEIGFLRIDQIVGNPKKNIPAIIPVCRATWWAGVASGRYPAGVLLGPRTRAWSVESIRALVAEMGQGAAHA